MTDDIDTENRAFDVDLDRAHDRLRRQVAAAIDELSLIRCPDPAAVDAFLTARLALHTLREVWLPNI